MTFKNQLVQLVKTLNTDVEECNMLTPQVCYFQISRLKLRLEQLIADAKRQWYLLHQVNPELLDRYFKDLLENVDNNPDISFRSTFKGPTQKRLIEMRVDDEVMADKAKEYGIELDDSPRKSVSGSEDESEYSEMAGVEIISELTSEEKDLREFLAQNPELENLRQINMMKIRKEIQSRRKHSVYTLVNKDGVAARCFVLDEGDLILFRKDPTGEELISRGVNSSWLKLDINDRKCGSVSYSLINQVKNKAVRFNLNTLASNFAMLKIDPLMTQGVNSMTGSLGTLLYDIVEGKKKLQILSKDFLKSSAQDFIMTMFVNSLPFVALALGAALGAYSVTSVLTNNLLTKKKKAQMITTILVKGGGRSAIALGGAIVGHILVPIPVVGSVVGSIIGGFAAEATFRTIDSALRSSALIEPFAFYCLCMLDYKGFWDKEAMPSYNNRIFEKYCKLISYISPIEPSTMEKLVTSQKKVYHSLVEAMYVKVADEPEEGSRPASHMKKWKTLIAFGVITYFHFLLSVKFTEMAEISPVVEEIHLSSIAKFSEIVELDSVCDDLARWFAPGGPSELNRVISGLAEFVKLERVRCIFVGNTKEAQAKEEELREMVETEKQKSGPNSSSKNDRSSEMTETKDSSVYSLQPFHPF